MSHPGLISTHPTSSSEGAQNSSTTNTLPIHEFHLERESQEPPESSHTGDPSNINCDCDSLLILPTPDDHDHDVKLAVRRLRWKRCVGPWVWEIGACVLVIASFAATLVVLAIEDGKPLEQWPWSVGPTAVVSFITAITKSSLLFAVTEVIGQLKWHHYEGKTRPLTHLQTFDDAGRGPLGAAALLWNHHAWSLRGSLAAIVVITSLFLDPFIQLVFAFPSQSRLDTSGAGTFHSTQVYDPNGNIYDPNHYGALSLDSKIQSAIITAAGGQTIPTGLSCSTGNCTWPSVTTLGVCSSCTNVTLQVKATCPGLRSVNPLQCGYSFPYGPDLHGVAFMPGGAGPRHPTKWNSSADFVLLPYESLDQSSSTAMLTAFNAIQIQTSSYVNSEQDYLNVLGRPLAWQCIFTFCEKTYENVTSINGAVTLPSPKEETLYPKGSVAPFGDMRMLYVLGKDPNSSSGTNYTINSMDYYSLSFYLSQLFSYSYIADGVSGFDDTNNGNDYVVPNLGFELCDAPDLGKTMQSMADGMTETIRNS